MRRKRRNRLVWWVKFDDNIWLLWIIQLWSETQSKRASKPSVNEGMKTPQSLITWLYIFSRSEKLSRQKKTSLRWVPPEYLYCASVSNLSNQDTVYFRVNFDKFNVHIRNSVSFISSKTILYLNYVQLIVEAAKERFNSGAAVVVQAALKLTESTQKNVAEVRSGNVSVRYSPRIIDIPLLFQILYLCRILSYNFRTMMISRQALSLHQKKRRTRHV